MKKNSTLAFCTLVLTLIIGASFIAPVRAQTSNQGQAKVVRLHGIKGADDRIIVNSAEYPWSAIGRLNKRNGGYCTGVMVGARLVATAAHCLWNPVTKQYLPPETLHFIAGYQRDSALGDAGATSVIAAPKYATGGGSGHDWALVVLDSDLGSATGTIGLANTSPPRGSIFVQAGYSQDQAHALTAHVNCRLGVAPARGGLLAHDCDAVAGDGGSPVLYADGKGFRIAALHIGTAGQGPKALGMAVPAAALLRAADKAGAKRLAPPPAVGSARETAGAFLWMLGYPDLAAFQDARGIPVSGSVTPAVLGQLLRAFRK